ncbi:MAG: hypothetical protein ACM309_02675 [Bacillota bacterium]
MATIRVSFAELRTTGHYSNMRAEASIETESQDPEQDFPALWERVRNEVRGQLDAERLRREEEWRKRYACADNVDDEDEDEDLPF